MAALDPVSPSIDETARERFERAWLGGIRPRLEEFLPGEDRPEYLATVEELVRIDLEFSWKAWSRIQDVIDERTAITEIRPESVEDYLRRFPRLRDAAIVERLQRQELRVRCACGDDVGEVGRKSAAANFDRSLDDSILSADEPKRVGSQEITRPAVPVEEFFRQLRKCDLLPAEEVNELSRSLSHSGHTPTSIGLAQELVRRQKLTAHQATALLQGLGASLVLGNYVILDKLGQGGMGVVYRAEHRRMRRRVALKVLAPGLVKSPEAVKRFQREVQAVARLDHPNIVAAHDADEAQGTHFLVMPFIEGTDLASYVKTHGPLAADKAISCILQAAQGLEYAHRHGVIHRDIKPANLLLGRDGIVKILDLGLARVSDSDLPAQNTELTNTGSIMGTVDYMSPEQAVDTRQADQRSDIYSLGCSLFYLLTGRPVYDGDTIMRKILAHRERPIPSLVSSHTNASGALEHVFQKMIDKRPEDRYQSVTEVVAALRSCLEGTASIPSLGAVTSEDAKFIEFLRQFEPEGMSRSARTATVGVTGKEPVAEAPSFVTGGPASDTATSRGVSPGAGATHRSKAGAVVWKQPRLLIGGGIAATVLIGLVVWSQTGGSTRRTAAENLADAAKTTTAGQTNRATRTTGASAGEGSSDPGTATALQFDDRDSYVAGRTVPFESLPRETNVSEALRIDGGAFLLDGIRAGGSVNCLLDVSQRDLAFRGRIRLKEKTEQWGNFGFLFRMKRNVYCSAGFTTDNHIQLTLSRGAEGQVLAQAAVPPPGADGWYHVEVTVRGKHLSVAIDGKVVVQTHKLDLDQTGKCGISAWNTAVEFRDAVLILDNQ